jgi:lipoyl(octanoyl) transferase
MKIFPHNEWRLIINSVGAGSWNMAVDEAILEFVAKKIQPPTLRLYAWNPYCLSLGHAQSIKDVDLPTLNEKGWGLVRRPTGGKAILHADEITYSITAPVDEPRVSGTVVESYQRLSGTLLFALKVLGIQADAKPKKPTNSSETIKPICFESPSDFEITWKGKKIIGSAQARRLQGVLQHGSIPLFGDITRIVQILNYPSIKEKNRSKFILGERACNLFNINQTRISWHSAASAIIAGFTNILNLSFNRETISSGEMERAWELVKTKYDHKDWTERI